jgi:uncharacterized protein YqeY
MENVSMRTALSEALKTAMKAGEKRRVSTIRMVQAAIKDKDIEARGAGRETASEAEILSLLQKMIKQRQESATVYEGAGRPELAAQEREEIAIIGEFQPQQLDEAETAAAVAAAVAETGATGPQDMGKVIGALRAAYAGRMDFGKASGLVKAALTR